MLQHALLALHGNLMGLVAVRAGSSFPPEVLVKNAQVVAPLRSLQPNARQPRTLYAVRNSITSNAIVLSNGCLVYQHFRLGSCILLRVAAFVQCCWPFVAHSNSYVFAPDMVRDLLACRVHLHCVCNGVHMFECYILPVLGLSVRERLDTLCTI